MNVRLGLVLAVVLVAAGCGDRAAESDAPARVPTGCLGLDAADCVRVADAVAAAIRDDPRQVTYIQVGPFGCPAVGCPRSLNARPAGDVTVEFAARDPVVFAAGAVGDKLDLTRHDESFVAVNPASRPLGTLSSRYQLGHCGIFSPIDVDGTFWDPVGFVDVDHADTVNSAAGVFTRTSPVSASLRTTGGLSVDLVRHQGVKQFRLCS
jgi:hypothetical protein